MPTDLRLLSRRERQIMDILYRRSSATALQVMQEMGPEPPSYSTVRTLLGILEKKGHVRHEKEGHHYTYVPITPAGEASHSALSHLMDTFFNGSASAVVSALIDLKQDRLTPNEYDEILELIEKSRKEGR
ncbi:MAG: BlaI/MecI/CopY family transcriptional regulator [Acidobacteriota bacterium]